MDISKNRALRIVFMFWALIFIAYASACAGGSSPSECYSGADSAEAAVEEFLDASVKNDVQRACVVVIPGIDDHAIEINMDAVRTFISRAGGLDNVIVKENPSEMLGAIRSVEVGIIDSVDSADFLVSLESSRYFVVPVHPSQSGTE